MRDYPSVPNVFRVASSHSINNMGVAGTPTANNYNNTKPTQQLNGYAMHSSNGNNNKSTVRSNSCDQQSAAPHQLTTTASIERQQQSPYATLPRGPRLQQLRGHSSSASSSLEPPPPPPPASAERRQQNGVINTISGSIPATGFAPMAGSFSDLQLNNLLSGHNRYNNNNSNEHNNSKGRRLREQQQPTAQRNVAAAAAVAAGSAANAYKRVERQRLNRVGGGISAMASASGGYLWLLTPVAARLRSHEMSIVVRRDVEERTGKLLMSCYDSEKALHEFSYKSYGKRSTAEADAQAMAQSLAYNEESSEEAAKAAPEKSLTIKQALSQEPFLRPNVLEPYVEIVEPGDVPPSEPKAEPIRSRQHKENKPPVEGLFLCPTITCDQRFKKRISVAIVIAALAGPQWLFTEEKLPNANYNGTANFNALDDGAYITKYTKSSLWILCTTLPGFDTYSCIKIDYFPKEGYQPDPHDSTPAIPYTVTKSCPIFVAAGIFLLISFIVFLIPTCSHQNNLYYFSAGILFIVSGLVMLIGLIAYISILKAEIGSKLRPRSTLQPALFKVTYGQSFFLFVFGFIATEFVGVLNIFLYINLQEVSYYSRLPCFSVANMHEKIKEGQHPLSHSYKRYKQPGTIAATHEPQPQQQQQRRQQQQHQMRRSTARTVNDNGRLHQVHDVVAGQTLPAGYACRKHPNLSGGGSHLNLYMHNDLERRFYFEKPAVSKCNLHSRSFAKSLNELCTEPALAPPPPPPAAVRMTMPRQTFGDLPQEFPLTRSVSTTTDLYSTSAPQLERKNRRNMATNTQPMAAGFGVGSGRRQQRSQAAAAIAVAVEEDDAAEEQAARLCGLKRGIRKTKDELFQEFCKRAGVRSKPKNIYYITSEDTSVPNPHDDQDEDEDDADGDEHGFKQFRSGAAIGEEQLYVVGDHAQLVVPSVSQQRRASMCVEPLPSSSHLRKLNSNLSLHTLQLQPERRSLYDLDCDSASFELWPGPVPGAGSQTRLPDYAPSQSRTLPRCFLRQPVAGSQDSLGSLQSNYSASQQRFSQMMLQHQQQLQQQNRFLSSQALYKHGEEQSQPPLAVSNASNNCPTVQQAAVQWPAAIPSSPANYANGYQLYAPAVAVQQPPAKFQRAYAFDDPQRRSSFAVGDAFDLDEIERERRRSHASLFGGAGLTQDHYDLINGTAV